MVTISITLMAQENKNEGNKMPTSSSLQIESYGTASQGSFYQFDKNKKHQHIIEEDDGFYYYLYDYACLMANICDEKYFIKLFMGKSPTDVLTSAETLKQWWKNSEDRDYMIVTNPDGQKVLIYKSKHPAAICLTYGTVANITWMLQVSKLDALNIMSNVAFVTALGNNATRDEISRDLYVNNQVEEGKYQPANGEPISYFFSTVKDFKKQHNLR